MHAEASRLESLIGWGISALTVHLDRHRLVRRRRRRVYKPEGTALSSPSSTIFGARTTRGEFMLADRRYCYPLTITAGAAAR
jgi:putative transposase